MDDASTCPQNKSGVSWWIIETLTVSNNGFKSEWCHGEPLLRVHLSTQLTAATTRVNSQEQARHFRPIDYKIKALL